MNNESQPAGHNQPVGANQMTDDLSVDLDKYVKTCPQCEKILPVISFDRDHRNSDGLCTRCRDCRRLDRTRHRKSNPYREWSRNVLQSRRQAGFTTNITPRQLADLARQTPVCPYCNTLLAWDRDDDPSLIGHPHKSGHWTPHLVTNKKVITLDSVTILCPKCFRWYINSIKPGVGMPGHIEDLGKTPDGAQVKKICFEENRNG